MSFMLCETGKEEDLKNLKDYVFERKLDGTRALAYIQQEGSVRLYNRNGLEIQKRYPDVVKQLSIIKDDVVLDGEIIADSFETLQIRNSQMSDLDIRIKSKMYPAKFIAFDCLVYNQENIKVKPLKQRKKFMTLLHAKYGLERLDYTDDYEKLLEQGKIEGWEGIIAKKFNSIYTQDRSWDWIKVKFFKEAEISFNGYEVNPAGITLTNDAGERVQCAGYQSVEVKKKIDEKGIALCNIQYLERTSNNRLRKPSFRGLI